jgi:HK97 gp10 family phage protein
MPAKVEGLGILERRLRALPERVRVAGQAALAKNGAEMVAMAQRLAPATPLDDPKDIRGSIRWQFQKNAKGAAGLAISVIAGNETTAAHVIHVEFGTSKMAAQPFFFVSYRTLKRRMAGRLTRAMKSALRRG